mmetsp:Transcript_101327/g.282023  ORF Transcript_101327/g.282023 Transcript_101327/m.282023 type:complete len:302 (-) Transcript_101327:10-915(-)
MVLDAVERGELAPDRELCLRTPVVDAALAAGFERQPDGTGLPHALAVLRCVVLIAAEEVGRHKVHVVEPLAPSGGRHLHDTQLPCSQGHCAVVEGDGGEGVEALALHVLVLRVCLERIDRDVDGTHAQQRLLARRIVPAVAGDHLAPLQLNLSVAAEEPHLQESGQHLDVRPEHRHLGLPQPVGQISQRSLFQEAVPDVVVVPAPRAVPQLVPVRLALAAGVGPRPVARAIVAIGAGPLRWAMAVAVVAAVLPALFAHKDHPDEGNPEDRKEVLRDVQQRAQAHRPGLAGGGLGDRRLSGG